jgi:hypothetical protein
MTFCKSDLSFGAKKNCVLADGLFCVLFYLHDTCKKYKIRNSDIYSDAPPLTLPTPCTQISTTVSLIHNRVANHSGESTFFNKVFFTNNRQRATSNKQHKQHKLGLNAGYFEREALSHVRSEIQPGAGPR